MTDALTEGAMSTSLLRVVERARREPEGRFHSLAHLMDVPALERAFHRLRADAAVGVDGVSKAQYGQALEANLEDLHGRLKTKRYRHQPLRRVHIPKGGGRTRPIGISAVEDKVVQGAVREVLEAVYEQDFVECSYGFRPGRGAHDAIRALNRAVYQGKVSWILEADIESFFDSLDRTKLQEMLRIRVADGSLRRLVGKCLRVGVLDGEQRTEPERGTAQGSGLSPLLGNVYLHYTLDVWFEREVKPRLGGEAVLVRYCDDFVIGLERREDAQRVMDVLPKRMERFGLRLHPEKTRLIAFERPAAGQRDGKGPGTFEFLGFTPVLAPHAARALADGMQDAQQGPETVRWSGLGVVPAPPAPSGAGPARGAHETVGRALQLLRGERQLPQPRPRGASHATDMAEMAAPSQSTNPSHVGAVQEAAGPLPAALSAGGRADMGSVATRHISGGAGWWQSPCPVLVRASGEQSPGATRPGMTVVAAATAPSMASFPRSLSSRRRGAGFHTTLTEHECGERSRSRSRR